MAAVAAIAELDEDRVVEGTFAVARKRRLRTRGGRAYLALELVDSTGRMDARVWHDVDVLDRRFGEGDPVRVLGRVERFRERLQLDVRALEPAAEIDPASLVPAARRDVDELDGFLEFLGDEIAHPQLRALVGAFLSDRAFRSRLRMLPASRDGHHGYAGGLLEHTVAVAALCREAAQIHRRLRGDLLLAAALLHDSGRTEELQPGPLFAPTAEGALLGHVHLGLRLIEARAGELADDVRAEVLHAVASHHDARAARTAEAAVLYHANALDAAAATRSVSPESAKASSETASGTSR
ncbi:MAG: HD domain-containing protein [Actinomycetota bacterium]|nr:HD domain-containing protein [Actinomycetota bacterium]